MKNVFRGVSRALFFLSQTAFPGRCNKNPDSLNETGKHYFAQQRFDDALILFDKALAISSRYVPAHINRGVLFKTVGRLDAALLSFDAALSIDKNNAVANYNKGLALVDMKMQGAALECFNKAVDFKPDFFEAYNSRGVVLKNFGRFHEALASFDAALALNPEFVDANWNRALLLILMGNYVEGWKEYEWRWMRDEMKNQRRFNENLLQDKKSVSGKIVVVYPEQGLGDFIQFCRYAFILNNIGAGVILVTPKSLVSLVSTMGEGIDVVEDGYESAFFDYQCPIMSLPLVLGTEVACIPAPIPYLFAEERRVAKWRFELKESTKPKIGLVWSGNKSHSNDHNRSIPFSLLESILDLPLDFHALQPDIDFEDDGLLFQKKGGQLHGAQLNDFSDTAGLIEVMDLIVTVDTSVAHLAGAMGKQVWILLPFVPDFRWMLDRADSPWYPTATLFRQPEVGDWGSVISEVAKRLCQRYVN